MRAIMRAGIAFALFALQVSANDPREQPSPGYRYWSEVELEREFNRQFARLKQLGYAEFFISEDDLNRYARNDRGLTGPPDPHSLFMQLVDLAPLEVVDGAIPFLIVIPKRYGPLLWRTGRIAFHDITGRAPRFSPNDVTDYAPEPDEPYLIFNVDAGASTVETSVEIAEWEWGSKRGLTLIEGLTLLEQFPDAAVFRDSKDEHGRRSRTYATPVFLGSNIGGIPLDPQYRLPPALVIEEAERYAEVRPVEWRTLTPNYTRFIFPSCDAARE